MLYLWIKEQGCGPRVLCDNKTRAINGISLSVFLFVFLSLSLSATGQKKALLSKNCCIFQTFSSDTRSCHGLQVLKDALRAPYFGMEVRITELCPFLPSCISEIISNLRSRAEFKHLTDSTTTLSLLISIPLPSFSCQKAQNISAEAPLFNI